MTKKLFLKFPERYYQTDAGVTSLSFSIKRPNLLAVTNNKNFILKISRLLGWLIQW
jgi:hypothetical protein